MTVRDATAADDEEVRSVHTESIRELGSEAYSQAQVTAWAGGCASADYAAAIESEATEYVVADQNDEVVGFGSLNLTAPDGYVSDPGAEVTAVYVHPGVARQGIGTAIYAELERRARTHGVDVLGLSASRNAVAFYRAHGYDRVRAYEHEFSAHDATGVTGTVVEMRKEL